MHQYRAQLKIIVLINLFLLILVGFYLIKIWLLNEKLKYYKNEHKQLTLAFKSEREKINASFFMQKKMNSLFKENANYIGKVCRIYDYTEEISEINTMSFSSHLDLLKIKPEMQFNWNDYEIYPLEITLLGTYKDFIFFTEKMRGSRYFLFFENLIISPANNLLVFQGLLFLVHYSRCNNWQISAIKSDSTENNYFVNIRDPFFDNSILLQNIIPDLTKIQISCIRYLGNIKASNKIIAVVEDMNGLVSYIREGDIIGINHLRVTKITTDTIYTSDKSQNIGRRD